MDAKSTASPPNLDVFLLSEAAAKLGIEVESDDPEPGEDAAGGDEDAAIRHPEELPS